MEVGAHSLILSLIPSGIRIPEYPDPQRPGAPLAVSHTGEAQLDVLSRRKSVEEAATLVQLGGAEKEQRGL